MNAGRSPGFVEPMVLAFLLLAAAVLGWMHWKVLPERSAPPPLPFDLRNPMLDAEVGECVSLESERNPAEVDCVRVVPPAVVLRPDEAKAPVPGFGDLRRALPYLVCELRFPPPGKRCDDPDVDRAPEIYPLGGFGLPLSVPALLQSIQPRWVERAGAHHFVYEVQMRRYDQFLRGPVLLYLDPDQPVTGVIMRQDIVGQGGVQEVLFTPVDCP